MNGRLPTTTLYMQHFDRKAELVSSQKGQNAFLLVSQPEINPTTESKNHLSKL